MENPDTDPFFQLKDRMLKAVSALMDAKYFAQFNSTPSIQRRVKELNDAAYVLLKDLQP